MAVHGCNRHLKRLAAPKLMPIARKGIKWLIKPKAGAHPIERSMALTVLLRDVLKVASNAREALKLLTGGEVTVDGKKVLEPKFPVGIMDVVGFPKIKSHYKILNVKSKLAAFAIPEAKSNEKLCKISNKSIIKGNKMQIALHDGKTITIERTDDKYKPGDSILIEIPKAKIKEHFKLEAGSNCYIAIGKHSGRKAVLEKIEEKPFGIPSDAHLVSEAGEKIITRKDYLFVVPADFSF